MPPGGLEDEMLDPDDLALVSSLLRAAQELGFVGPGPLDPHIEHCKLFHDAIADLEGPAIDLGTGGGLPALVLAVADRARSWTFVESQAKRAEFLERQVEAAGLDRVKVLHARAEDLAKDTSMREMACVVTARSFGPPAVVAECAAGFLTVGGSLVVSEPPEGSEGRWPAEELAVLGLAPGTFPRGLAVIAKVSPTPPRYPRKAGLPQKRPLFHVKHLT